MRSEKDMYSNTQIRSQFVARQISLSHSAVNRSVAARQAAIARLQEQLTTGKQINRPSDDAPGFSIADAMSTSLRRYEQYERTITGARLWLDESESALSGISDILTDAYEEGIRTINATMNSDDLEASAQEIEGWLTMVVDRLNAKAGNEYVFAGGKTTAAPFAIDNSASADAAGVTYYGDDLSLTRTITDDLDLPINLTGLAINDVGSGDTITSVLQELADAVRSGNTTAIETALEKATGARNHVLGRTAEIGSVSNRMQIAEGQLQETITLATARRSRVEDADVAETITELQLQQLRMQAATQALLSIQQLDITNFLT